MEKEETQGGGMRDEAVSFCTNYRYDCHFVLVLPLVCFSGSTRGDSYYGSFEVDERQGRLTLDV